jgi:hypothetical protein
MPDGKLSKSELYPFYSLYGRSSDYGHMTAVVPDTLIAEWNAVMPRFRALQRALELLYEGPSPLVHSDSLDEDVIPDEEL